MLRITLHRLPLPASLRFRVKMLLTTARPHNQKDADKAGNVGAADNGPKLRSMDAMAQ